ncbi:MAG: hypothetical protein H6R10_692 [Rhodocyclaceae bacterium]|nr:hypothetical protein [Rhodocyclaceae bacterium]
MIRYAQFDGGGSAVAFLETSSPVDERVFARIPDNLAFEDSSEVYRRASGEIVKRAKRPSPNHRWDAGLGLWLIDPARAAQEIRSERDRRFAATVDRISAVRWAAMNDGQRAAWTSYRQSLLDITHQPGFPETIIWPASPTEL